MERGIWDWAFSKQAAAAAARAERAARLRSKRAARERAAMSRRAGESSRREPNNFPGLHAPAPAADEVLAHDLVAPVQPQPQQRANNAPAPCQLAPAPVSAPRRLHFRRAPQDSLPAPVATAAAPSLAQVHPTSQLAAILDYQTVRAQQLNNQLVASNLAYAGQYFYGHPHFAACAASTDGFQAQFTMMQAYFASEPDVLINASPASSAISTTEESFYASQSRPPAPKRRRLLPDLNLTTLVGFHGHAETDQSETADNFTDVVASSSSAATRPVSPLLPKHLLEVDVEASRGGDGGAL